MALPPLSILLALCPPALGYVIIIPVDDGGGDGDGDGDDTTINVVALVLTLVGLIVLSVLLKWAALTARRRKLFPQERWVDSLSASFRGGQLLRIENPRRRRTRQVQPSVLGFARSKATTSQPQPQPQIQPGPYHASAPTCSSGSPRLPPNVREVQAMVESQIIRDTVRGSKVEPVHN